MPPSIKILLLNYKKMLTKKQHGFIVVFVDKKETKQRKEERTNV